MEGEDAVKREFTKACSNLNRIFSSELEILRPFCKLVAKMSVCKLLRVPKSAILQTSSVQTPQSEETLLFKLL